jgi:transposase
MLAEVVDAVVGVDTHRDTHEVEIASPNGVPIAQCSIRNDSTGYAQLLAWIVDHAPGPRLVASVEGSRSYGVGLSRALSSAGVPVLEAEQPPQSARRGKGKSDAIDAHLAVLAALRLDATHLPAPRVDGDREALRILPRAAPHANHGDGVQGAVDEGPPQVGFADTLLRWWDSPPSRTPDPQ